MLDWMGADGRLNHLTIRAPQGGSNKQTVKFAEHWIGSAHFWVGVENAGLVFRLGVRLSLNIDAGESNS